MLYFCLFIVEVFVLFLLSRQLFRKLYLLIFKITRSNRIAMYILSLLFVVGTLIHELAHWLVATVLLVHTGRISLWPEIQENGIKMGSVEIAKTDPLRRSIIGVAPFIVGTVILYITLLFAASATTTTTHIVNLTTLVTCYLVFEIGNTMFSSKKDLEGTAKLILFLVVIYLIVTALGVRFPSIDMTLILTQEMQDIFQKLCEYLLLPIFIDLGVVLLVNFL